MGRAHRRGTAAAVAGIALAMTACSPTPGGRERQACTWTIGIMGALEGEIGRYLEPRARGVQVAVDLANESGDLACTVETRTESTGEDYKESPATAERLVADDDLVACVCGYGSRDTLETGDIFEREGVALLSTAEASSLREEGFDTWFRLVAPVDRQATATGVYIKRVMAPRRVAIVTVHLSYAYDMAENLADALGRRFQGPAVPINPEGTGVYVAARKLAKMSPDLVFYAGYAPEGWEMLDAMRDDGLKMPFVAAGGAMYAPPARAHKAGHALLSCACSDPAQIDGAEDFVAEYRARYDTDPRRLAADTFDGTNVVIDALRELDGSESTEDVRAQVVAHLDEAAGVEGTVKSYTWDEDGELVGDDRDVWMWEWRKRGGFRMLGSVAELTS